ncbi:MAG: hypothetical protein IID59_07225 [Proteobacteria bacterium]|nr:hypothetical protein [Pseudomonadota bacterium]
MAHWYSSRVFAAVSLIFVIVAFSSDGGAAKESRSVNMTGEWAINDELTDEVRRSLPEPKEGSGFLTGIFKGTNISVSVPGIPVGVPVPGMGNDAETDDSKGARLHSYGRVAAIEIRDWPGLFGIDYGNKRGWMYTPDETTVETIGKRKITTKSGWRGDRYIVRKSADDGSKMSEEFELINDGQQLKWTVVERRKGHPEITDVAIYDRVDQPAED